MATLVGETPVTTGLRQSSSSVALQPGAQHPSPSTQAVIGVNEHSALQLSAEPTRVSVVHAKPSSQLVGQSPSQVSDPSTTPLPHVGEQSSSLSASQPAGQQPSPSMQLVISVKVHAAVHSSADPVSSSIVQATPSSQLVGQFPSQVSGAWTTPSPHVGPPSGGPPSSMFPASPGPSRGHRPRRPRHRCHRCPRLGPRPFRHKR